MQSIDNTYEVPTMARQEFPYLSAETTESIPIPRNPLEQVIGQDEAVRICKIAAMQRRHVLLVGPPGTGKSMLAQATAYCLPKPQTEIRVQQNFENPERPTVVVLTADQLSKEARIAKQIEGISVDPREVPSFVAERLGYRCKHCGKLSKPTDPSCPSCGYGKNNAQDSPFNDLLFQYPPSQSRISRVSTNRMLEDGSEEIIFYEAAGDKIRIIDKDMQRRIKEQNEKKPYRVLVPLKKEPEKYRNTFITATGASETEMLGDVRHDPYGGHAQIGQQPYMRVVAGAVHEAHEGVLFVDELSALHGLQRFILTAMQEKKYAIVGKNPQSSGASVRVDDVPCDFILIAASNINDIPGILPPLRSRIIGNGYEVLLQTHMPDNELNRSKLAQFVAQEVKKDGKIPPATIGAVNELIEEGARRAKRMDEASNSLTLRLRELSGVLRLAGDLAVMESAELIDERMITAAITKSRTIEEQLSERYGSVWNANRSETTSKEPRKDYKEIS